MLYLSRKSGAGDSPGVYDKDLQLVKRFMMLLRENIVHKKMVANYAGELCVTPGYLNRVVKKVSGFPASYHIQQYIILEAKRQAIHLGSTMKEIAYTLGFTDPAHFSKFFKNGNGASFSQFKRTVY